MSESNKEAAAAESSSARHVENFGADPIQSRHGRVNRWLLLVYLILFVWALYYGFSYWGGLGPGLDLHN